jgi:WD40-like Beta Propeller Repeat
MAAGLLVLRMLVVDQPCRGAKTRVAEGRTPSFSPNGKRIAYTGYVGDKIIYSARDGAPSAPGH